MVHSFESMGAWGETKLYLYDPYLDPRTTVVDPIFTRLQKMRFARAVLPDSGKAAFNRVFGGPRRANPLGTPPLYGPGVPCFAWTK